MKRLYVLVLALLLGFTATACSDSTGPGGSIAGSYSLQSIDGRSLPYVMQNSASLYSEVISAQIVLDADGDYRGVTRYRETEPGRAPVLVDESFDGYWTLSGNQIVLTQFGFPNDPSYGTIVNNRLTISDFGYTLIYTR